MIEVHIGDASSTEWTVWWIGLNDRMYSCTFSGPHAEERARDYKMFAEQRMEMKKEDIESPFKVVPCTSS